VNVFSNDQILADSSSTPCSLYHPEWLRIPEATRLFGLSRSKLYALISERRIKSFCLRERNKLKGIRLLNYDSLAAFLENEAKTQEQEAGA
jgi:hypothetical protein